MEALAEAYWRGELPDGDSVSPRHNPPCRVHLFKPDLAFLLTFANVTAVATPAGLVLIDCGHQLFGAIIKKRIRGAFGDARVHTAVYTHGHVDHCMGILAFEECDQVRVVAHKAVPARFDRYKLTLGYNGHINGKQFNSPPMWPAHYRYPDVTYEDTLSLDVGGVPFELHHHRGETDDATWVWLPTHKCLCTGDFIIWASPNCGNPQKVQRYPLDWITGLRTMLKYDAELLLPGHGPPVIGRDRVRQILEDTAAFLEDVCHQSLRGINAGIRLADIVRTIELPQHLLAKPYLRPVYDDPRFIVHNIWRQFAGWWDQDPAHLRVGHEDDVAHEVASLAGGPLALAYRASDLAHDGKLDTAVQLIEWAQRVAHGNTDVHKIRAAIFRRKVHAESSLMAKGIYLAAQMESERVLNTRAWRLRQFEYRVLETMTALDMAYEMGTIASTARSVLSMMQYWVKTVLVLLGLWGLVGFVLDALPFEIKEKPIVSARKKRHDRDQEQRQAWATIAVADVSHGRRPSSSLVWPPKHRHAAAAEALEERFKLAVSGELREWRKLKPGSIWQSDKLLRCESTVRACSVQQLVSLLTVSTCRETWDPTVGEHHVWQTLDPSTRLVHVVASHKAPVADRDYALLALTETSLTDGRTALMMCSVEDVVIAPVPGRKRGHIALAGWLLEPQRDRSGVRVVQLLELAEGSVDALAAHMHDTQRRLAEHVARSEPAPPFHVTLGGHVMNAPEWRAATKEYQIAVVCDSTVARQTTLAVDARCFGGACEVTITPAFCVRAAVEDGVVVLHHDDDSFNGACVAVHVAPLARGRPGQIKLRAGTLTPGWHHQRLRGYGEPDDDREHGHNAHDRGHGHGLLDDAADVEDEDDAGWAHAAANDVMCAQPQ